MKQRWNDLFFMHWKLEPEFLSGRLPEGLELDTIDGGCWMSVVGFKMSHIRPSWAPSWFNLLKLNELNLRTYVVGPDGGKGVYFFTLESDHRLGNWVANRFLSPTLPQQCAHDGEARRYSNYYWRKTKKYFYNYEYLVHGDERYARDNEVEKFLYERYTFYTDGNDGCIYKGVIDHAHYKIQDTIVLNNNLDLFYSCGFRAPSHPEELTGFSSGMDIIVKSFKKLQK